MCPTSENETTGASTDPIEAQIIGPDVHPIRTEMIDRDALFILRKLNKEGFSGYLVGGGVRDLFLGKTPKDFDISTDARPGQLRKLFPHSKTIGRRFRLVQIFFKNGKTIEVSTLRSLSEHDLDGPETVLAPNNTFGTLSEDARRRDLTINSLFYEIQTNTIIDYVDGIKDLQNGIIQIVGDPLKRISRDPVRILRAIRHSARNNFTIEENTWKAICLNRQKISLCPPSRLRDEFLKDLYSGTATPWFNLAMNSGIFSHLFPLYASVLNASDKKQKDTARQLQLIFETIDRVNTTSVELRIHRQPDYFHLAFILTPWMEEEFQLYSNHRKGGPLFQLAKTIRTKIDHTIGQDFNLRRSAKQEIVSLAVNLAQLIHYRQKGDWPKWLKKKSYFQKCLLFYHLYQIAAKEVAIDLKTLLGSSSPEISRKQTQAPARTSPTKYRPAFSPNKKGGVFGFKK